MTTCEKYLDTSSAQCGRRAVAIITSESGHRWAACARHADRALDQMRDAHEPDLHRRVRDIQEG